MNSVGSWQFGRAPKGPNEAKKMRWLDPHLRLHRDIGVLGDSELARLEKAGVIGTRPAS
jgi:hypothetical protein